MGGTMRSPLTGTIFALELTHDINALPALLIASVVALRLHRAGDEAVDPDREGRPARLPRQPRVHASIRWSCVSVGEVMTTEVVTVPASLPVQELLRQYFLGDGRQRHQGYPVVDADGRLLGVVTRANLLEDWVAAALADGDGTKPGLDLIIAYDLVHREPITVLPWESCRTAAERMAEDGVGRLPVVSPDDPGR